MLAGYKGFIKGVYWVSKSLINGALFNELNRQKVYKEPIILEGL